MKNSPTIEQRALIRRIQELNFSDEEVIELVRIFTSLLDLIKERKK